MTGAYSKYFHHKKENTLREAGNGMGWVIIVPEC